MHFISIFKCGSAEFKFCFFFSFAEAVELLASKQSISQRLMFHIRMLSMQETNLLNPGFPREKKMSFHVSTKKIFMKINNGWSNM